MADLTSAEKAHRYDREVQKKKIAKIDAKALALRSVEGGVAGVESIALGMLAKWKPEWQSVFGFMPVPETASLVLGGLGFMFLKPSQHVLKEVAAGMFLAGEVPIARRFGEYLYDKVAA